MRAALSPLFALLGLMRLKRLGLRKPLLLGLGEEGLALGLSVAAPFLLRLTINKAAGAGPIERVGLVSGFVLSWTIPTVLSTHRLVHTADLVEGLFGEMAARILGPYLPRAALGEGAPAGRIIGVLERLPFALQFLLDGFFWRAAPLLCQLALGLIILALTLPLPYTGLLTLCLAAYVVGTDVGMARLADASAVAHEAGGQLSNELADVVRNAPRVAFNATVALEVEQLRSTASHRAAAHRDVAALISGSSALQALALSLGLTLVLVLAGQDLSKHRLTLGDFVLLQAFTLRLAAPLSGLAMTFRQSAAPLNTLRDALGLMDIERPAAAQTADPRAPAAGSLNVDAVTHRYGTGRLGLHGVSLSLQPDQIVVLVGANGSGKSTLARIMAGVLAPTAGAVRLGDTPLASLSPETRSRVVLYVPQTLSLFNRTLRENALYPPAALEAASLAQRLQSWRFNAGGEPIDLDEEVGQAGGRLSGGQIQKLELARVCTVESQVLILDETTSALDPISEMEILRTLRARFAGRLLVLVSHRRTVAESADRVVFLQSGRLAGVGRHASLMTNPAYRALWAPTAEASSSDGMHP